MLEEIKELEERLLLPEVRKCAEQLEDLLADDFAETGSTGHTYNKKEIIAGLSTEDSSVMWSLSNFKVRTLAPNIILATYLAEKKQLTGVSFSSRTSIWKNDQDRWQMIFHQGTPVKP